MEPWINQTFNKVPTEEIVVNLTYMYVYQTPVYSEHKQV
jgi:hypothetical protein